MLDRTMLSVMYFKTVKQLGLSAKEVVIEAGGALVAMGVSETTDDLDLSIPAEVFERLRKDYPVKDYGGLEVMSFNEHVNLRIYKGDWSTNFKTVQGITVPSLDTQIQLKRTLMALPERTEAKRTRDARDLTGLMTMYTLATVARGL